MRKRLIGKALVASSLFTVLIAGCGGGDDPTPVSTATSPAQPTPTQARTATSAPAPTATPRPTTAVQPTATSAPVSSGSLNIVFASLSPFGVAPVINGTAAPSFYVDTMYDYIVGADIEGKPDDKSGFATTWTASPDSTTWTIKVKDNVLFHNGDKATAQDVVFTVGLGLAPNSKFGATGDLRRDVASITAPDDTTVVVKLNSRQIFWPVAYISRVSAGDTPTLLVPKKYVDSVGVEAANKAGVGTGPYRLKSVTVGDRIVVEAVDKHFFFGVPRTKTVTFSQAPEEGTRLALLKTKAADLTPISFGSRKQAQDAALRLFVQDSGQLTVLYTAQWFAKLADGSANPLANPKVRRALFWFAIDRKAIVDSFFPGGGFPSLNYPISSADFTAYKQMPVPAPNPSTAKSLLAEAGYPNGFEMDYYLIATGFDEVMESIAVYWEQVGIKIKRQPITAANFNSVLIEARAKGGFSKATAGGMYRTGTGAISVNFASLPHNKDSIYSINWDPEGARLAAEFAQATSVQDYILKGQTYLQWVYENHATWLTIAEVGEIWTGTENVSPSWKLGRGKNGARMAYAAALR